MGGGIGGNMGFEMETAMRVVGMFKSVDSWLTISSGVSAPTRSAASVVPPCCVITMRAVIACREDVIGNTVPPIVMPLPYGSSCVRTALPDMARVLVRAKLAACRRRPAPPLDRTTSQAGEMSRHSVVSVEVTSFADA